MPCSVAQLFFERANTCLDAEAVRLTTRSWSYAQLAALSASVARYLHENGLEAGDRVATVLSNSPEYIAIYFGVQLAGGVIVPLNVLDKSRTVRRQAEHCRAKFMFAASDREDLFVTEDWEVGVHHVKVEHGAKDLKQGENQSWRELVSNQSISWQESAADLRADALAAILYTSGTTNRPKGVMLSHANLLANMQSILEFIPIEPSDRCLVVLPFYHSFGNSLLTTHLCSGACVVLQNNIAFPKLVLNRIGNERISALYGVPLTFSLLFGKGVPEDVDLSSLRYMAQAGGAMHRSQIEQLCQSIPDVDIYVMYGQTEATARISYVPPNMLRQKLGSAGRAVPGVEIEIRGPDGATVDPGETGEIWVRGANVMVGYWDDEEESSEVLMDGWLWTRDRGRLEEDGYLYIEGRSSDMIKTGANRVSPDEIEEVIAGFSGIKEVGVSAIPDETLGQAVLAVVVPDSDQADISEQKLKAFCLSELAPYKVPKKVIVVPELPRTSTGKIQRRLLVQLMAGVKDSEC